MKTPFRKEIAGMSGYVPGEQPKERGVVKLNTNENPFPPSPRIKKLLDGFDPTLLRLYPDPECSGLRRVIAAKFAVREANVIVGNGSDDILNIITRCCADKNMPVAFFEPSYSLYPVLARMQGARCIKVPLDGNFSIPRKIPDAALSAPVFMITRPNAPTGNSFPKSRVEEICRKSKGIVFADEAYADFADDNCLDLLGKFNNLIVCRTLSKSYSLAGIRLGFAIASEGIIEQMMKVKDSYNVCRLTQEIAKIAMLDDRHFRKNVGTIRENRENLSAELKKLGFEVVDSQANFVFASPPEDGPSAHEIYLKLKARRVFVRYFPGERTGRHLRITVGTRDQITRLIHLLREFESE